MKKILIAALLVSRIGVYGTELEEIEKLMVKGEFDNTVKLLDTFIATPEILCDDKYTYACLAALNHMILKQPQNAASSLEIANDFKKRTPYPSLANEYLHFLAHHAYTHDQASFNRQIIFLMQEKNRLSEEEKAQYSKKIRTFLRICTNNLEDLENLFVSYVSSLDNWVEKASVLMEAKQYTQAWDTFDNGIKETIKMTREIKRETITKLFKKHRSSLFQKFVRKAFDANDYETGAILTDMLMAPGERHSYAHLGGLIFYGMNDDKKLKKWVNEVTLEMSNPKELVLPVEIGLDQAFCVLTAHHLYQTLKIKKNNIDNLYKKNMENINQEDFLTLEGYYTDFMNKAQEHRCLVPVRSG